MYIANEYVYGKTTTAFLKVCSLEIIDFQRMLLTFSTGEKRIFHANVLTGPVFDPLKDPAIFENAALDHGVVTWLDGTIDCAPEFMYENSTEYI